MANGEHLAVKVFFAMLRMEIPGRKNFEQHPYIYIYIYIYIFPHDIVCVYIHIYILISMHLFMIYLHAYYITYQNPQIHKPMLIARVSGVSLLL